MDEFNEAQQVQERAREELHDTAVLSGASISDPEPVNFSCAPENWAYSLRVDRKRCLRTHQFPLSRCNCTIARLAVRMRVARYLQS